MAVKKSNEQNLFLHPQLNINEGSYNFSVSKNTPFGDFGFAKVL